MDHPKVGTVPINDIKAKEVVEMVDVIISFFVISPQGKVRRLEMQKVLVSVRTSAGGFSWICLLSS